MSGYSPAILAVRDEVDKFLCIQCKLLLRNPLQSYCGHRFCRNCLDDIFRQNATYNCPICYPEDPSEDSILKRDTVFPDRAIYREMKNLQTKCIYDNCRWKGPFSQYEKHEPICEYRLVECTRDGCSEKIRRIDLDEHLEKTCVMREETCSYCQERMVFRDMQRHHNICPKYPVPCRNCRQEIMRGKLEAHMDLKNGDCPRKMQQCDYVRIGCETLIEVGTQVEHNTSYIEHHMALLLQAVSQISEYRENVEESAAQAQQLTITVDGHGHKIETLRMHLDRMKNDLERNPPQSHVSPSHNNLQKYHEIVDKLEKSTGDLNNNCRTLDRRVTTYEGIVAVLNVEVERNAEIVQKMNNGQKDFRENLNGMDRKTKAQDRIIALKDVTLAEQDLRIQSLEMASYDGILTWRITGIARKKRDAISGRTLSIYSPYFFSSRYGYKMCARIYLNGDGMGKGSHVSLFFVIMKGDYDAILKWPFSQKVTFMWIDQNNREHVIDAFRPDPESSSFKRPTGDMNIASGCPLFMALNLLDSGGHAYIKDDTAFLRIIVDTSDL
ncbi:TNF receptor-associated factor 2-like [Glandiceps talaboti]